MGNSCASARDPPNLVFLDEKERAILNEKFAKLSFKELSKSGAKILSPSLLRELFPENQTLAEKIYDFIKFNGNDSQANFEGFVQSVDFLTKDNRDAPYYRGFDKVEMMAIISIEKFSLKNKEELKKSRVSYVECIEFLKDILKIINYDKIDHSVDEHALKIFADSIMDPESGVTTLWNMIISIKQQMVHVNECVTIYFLSKFLQPQLSLKLPITEAQSNILTDELLAFFYLGNPFMQQSKRIKLLFSSGKHGFNFAEIVNGLTGYEGPTFILVKHEETLIGDKGKKDVIKHAFGAFSRIMWKNDAIFHGNEESYLFSLYPKFKNFYALRKHDCEKNYQYLWYNEHGKNVAKVGIGFGGFSKKSFRIWIDGEDIENRSYCSPFDKTYEAGYLISPHVKNLKICDLEIWGLGAESIYNTQLLLRQTLSYLDILKITFFRGYLGNLDVGGNKGPFKEFNSVKETGITKEQLIQSMKTQSKFRYTSMFKG